MPSGNAGLIAPADPQRRGRCALASVPLGKSSKNPDVSTARVVDVKHFFRRRECEAVGQHKIADQQGSWCPDRGVDAVDAGKGRSPLLGRGGIGPGIGEVDARPSDLTTTSLGRLSCRPWKLLATNGDAGRRVSCRVTRRLSCSQAINLPWRSRVSPLARFVGSRTTEAPPAGLVLHAPVVVNVAEQQIVAFLPPTAVPQPGPAARRKPSARS